MPGSLPNQVQTAFAAARAGRFRTKDTPISQHSNGEINCVEVQASLSGGSAAATSI